MIKGKFGRRRRSDTLIAQSNEALGKVLCRNLCVVIQSMDEFGVDASLGEKAETVGVNDQISKHPLNAPGRYYVDCNTCLDHECCIDTAPNNFRMDEHFTAYVFKQPTNTEELAQCRQALDECPIDAIHEDGERNSA